MTRPQATGTADSNGRSRSGRRRAVPVPAWLRKVDVEPGQMELGFLFETVPAASKDRTRRPKVERPELPLGPLARSPKPKPGPLWPKFRALYEQLDGGGDTGEQAGPAEEPNA